MNIKKENEIIEIVKVIFTDQVERTRLKDLPKVQYNLDELMEWVFNQENLESMYDFWIIKKRAKDYKLTIDRFNDYDGYNFKNIRLLFWCLNNEKGCRDRVIGINNKQSKAVLQYLLDGETLVKEYHSVSNAAVSTNSHTGQIAAVCKGRRNTHNGYIWKYKN